MVGRLSAAWYGGIAALALGLVLALYGRWAFAIASLAVAALLLGLSAGNRDQRRVARVLNDWTAYAAWVEGRQADRRRKAHDELSSLTPPPELRGEHDRLVGLLSEAESAWLDHSVSFPERARRRTVARRAAKQLLDSLPPGDYCRQVERVRAAQRAEYEAAAADADHSLTAAIRKLDSTDHAGLTAALRAHLAATHDLRAAQEALDPDRAATAAAAWEEATARVHEQAQRLA